MQKMLKRVKEQLLPKFTKQNKEENILDISLSDCTCPICLEVLVEPVKMPCKHEICLNCFDTMLDKTNLCCPMCRMRISTWSRNARLTNTLVDNDRWKQIQKAFPNEIKNRLEGKTQKDLVDSLSSMMPAMKKPKCAEQGEIRQEYLDFIRREEERLRIEKENEERMSFAYIEQVMRQEGAGSLNEYLERQRQLNLTNTQQIIQQPQIQPQQQIVQQRVAPAPPTQQAPAPPPPPTPQQQPVLNRYPILGNITTQEQTPALNTPEQPVPSENTKKRNVKRTYSINSEFTRITRSKSLKPTDKPNLDYLQASTPIVATTASAASNNNPTTSRASRSRKTHDQTLDTISSTNTSRNTSSILEADNTLNSTTQQRRKQTQTSRAKRK